MTYDDIFSPSGIIHNLKNHDSEVNGAYRMPDSEIDVVLRALYLYQYAQDLLIDSLDSSVEPKPIFFSPVKTMETDIFVQPEPPFVGFNRSTDDLDTSKTPNLPPKSGFKAFDVEKYVTGSEAEIGANFSDSGHSMRG